MRITAVIAASLLLCVLAACSQEPGDGGDAPITPSGGYWKPKHGHAIGVVFHLEVSEYQMGSGPDSITELARMGTHDSQGTYDTFIASIRKWKVR